MSVEDENPPNPIDLDRLLIWLESIADQPERMNDLDAEIHRRLLVATGRIALPNRLERRRFAQNRRRAEANRTRQRDDAALEGTSNRARKRALAFPVAPAEIEISDEHRRLLELQARRRETGTSAESLLESRTCYVCKAEFRELHHHYDSMCSPCATLNWTKRTQSADLSGRVALVTGARVKIGYEIVLLLLRAGARVIATTRFVVDAAERFRREADFDEWADRLELHALDLRNTPSVERFCAERLERESGLDFLVHNACQTVRRPPAYYEEMVAGEDPARLPQETRGLIGSLASEGLKASDEAGADRAVAVADAPDDVAALSTLDLLGEAALKPLFPQGMRDGDGQPLDLRATNSWRMNLHEVSTLELIEVQLVNAIAPFVLNARLKSLMLAVPTQDKHIVHVSAMEGQFYRTFKTTRHPHTNMAKAALNMMTRTSAADFARDGIHMNSVDTGWVTDEDPFEKAVDKQETQRFTPPLDALDGAARVLDPIFSGLNSGQHAWGQFLKDYAPTRW